MFNVKAPGFCLDICRYNLADQGIAYISYNVLPGWQFNKSMRDMMLFRTRHIQSPADRAVAADKFEEISADALELDQFIDFINNTLTGSTISCLQGGSSISHFALN